MKNSTPVPGISLADTFLRIAAAPTLDQRLQLLTEEVREIVGAHQSVISMTEDQNWSQGITAVSLSEKYARWRTFSTRPDGTGIYRLVAEHNQPMRMTQAELEAHPAWRGFGSSAGEHPPMRGWLAAPLVGRGGRNLGVIQLSDKYEGEFSEEDLQVVLQFAQYAAALLELALLERENAGEQRQFRVLANMIPQLVWVSTVGVGNDYLNDRWYEYTGMARPVQGERPVVDWKEYLHPDDLHSTLEAWKHSVETGNAFQAEYRFRRHDGVYRWFVGQALPLRNENGQIVRWFGTCTDIEEQKQAQQQREALLEAERAARSEAERAARLKDEFVTTLSHELRTPLHAILGWAQLLRNGEADPEAWARGLEVIERNARLQAQMVDDLLDLNRIASGKLRLDCEVVELGAVAQAVVEGFMPAASTAGVDLTCRAQGTIHTWGDRERIAQVVGNLVSNALKFTPTQGSVEVTVSTEETEALLCVRDNGIGIPPDLLPVIFERFRQADGSLTRRHGGLGLGLAIVKSLSDMHGGRVEAFSAGEGQGACFRVWLPLHAGAPASAGPSGPAPPMRELEGKQVLVVDDDPDAREVIARLLEQAGASVVAAGSAREALERFGPEFHLLVSDVGMPDIDGYEFLRLWRAREQQHCVPAIALTAMARREDRERAFQAGFGAHLSKPVEAGLLLRLARQLVAE